MASDFSIRHAAHLIRRGGIIAYPTDTIYGLGCNPYDADATERLSMIKRRSTDKPFILLAADIKQLAPLIIIDKAQERSISQTSEPISWVIDARPHAPAWLTDRENTLTVRISQNETVIKLCEILGHAIISTSANPSGRVPAKNNLEIRQYFQGTIDKILATNKKL
ncbi:MAG TPA: Sua5/YciO/YrdC/YwlC family protein, partial [Gammaproteobacteria bacterium]|nr:Sua5/YciO/YrdC/YwlC family protein [Gammaproteobacteria bacterium]